MLPSTFTLLLYIYCLEYYTRGDSCIIIIESLSYNTAISFSTHRSTQLTIENSHYTLRRVSSIVTPIDPCGLLRRTGSVPRSILASVDRASDSNSRHSRAASLSLYGPS
jgi:hypothetical protein